MSIQSTRRLNLVFAFILSFIFTSTVFALEPLNEQELQDIAVDVPNRVLFPIDESTFRSLRLAVEDSAKAAEELQLFESGLFHQFLQFEKTVEDVRQTIKRRTYIDDSGVTIVEIIVDRYIGHVRYDKIRVAGDSNSVVGGVDVKGLDVHVHLWVRKRSD